MGRPKTESGLAPERARVPRGEYLLLEQGGCNELCKLL